MCILINSEDFDFLSKIDVATHIKNYTTFPEQKFSDSQQGHISLFSYNGCKAYAIYLSLGLFYTNIVNLIKKRVHIQ